MTTCAYPGCDRPAINAPAGNMEEHYCAAHRPCACGAVMVPDDGIGWQGDGSECWDLPHLADVWTPERGRVYVIHRREECGAAVRCYTVATFPKGGPGWTKRVRS